MAALEVVEPDKGKASDVAPVADPDFANSGETPEVRRGCRGRPPISRSRNARKFHLRTLQPCRPGTEVCFGHSLGHPIRAPPVNPVGTQRMVEIVKTEENGPGVNLAVRRLSDGWWDARDCAAVATNDRNIAEAMRMVRQHLASRRPAHGERPCHPERDPARRIPPSRDHEFGPERHRRRRIPCRRPGLRATAKVATRTPARDPVRETDATLQCRYRTTRHHRIGQPHAANERGTGASPKAAACRVPRLPERHRPERTPSRGRRAYLSRSKRCGKAARTAFSESGTCT